MIEIQEIININTEQGRDNIEKLRKEISDLRNALGNLTEDSEEYQLAAKQIYKDQQQLASIMNASKKYVEAEEGSMNHLLATLRKLKEQWKDTADATQRARLGEQINDTKAKINEMNESIGNYQHNVGNYSQGIIDAFGRMGIAVGGDVSKMSGMFVGLQNTVGNLGGAFKKLWAVISSNPIGALLAALGALIGAFMGLRKAVDENEELQRRYNEAVAAFRPLGDMFKNWVDDCARAFVSFIEMLASAWEWLRKVHAAYLDWLTGSGTEHQDKVAAEQEFAKSVARSENAIIDLERTTKRMNAVDSETVALLREEASVTTDNAKRTELLIKARDKMKEINERNIKLAEEEYELLKKQTATTANNIEVNNKLVDAELKVIQTRAQGRMSLLRLNRQIETYGNAAGKAGKQASEAAKEAERLAKEALKAHEAERKEAEKILKEAEEALKEQTQIEKEEYERRRQLLQDHNLSTKALDEGFRRKKLERQKDNDRQALEDMKKRIEDEYALTQRRNRTEVNAYDYEANVNLNNAEYEAYKAFIEAKIDLNNQLMQSYEEGSEERRRLEQENALMYEDIIDKRIATDKKNANAYDNIMKLREKATSSMVKGSVSLLQNLSGVMGENTKMAKGFAIAAATIDAIQASIAGFKAGYNQWKDTGAMAWMAPVQGAINAAVALSAGFAQVQQIRNVDTSGNANGGGSAPVLAMPNIAGLNSPIDYTRQITTETEKEELNRENRVYILESDIQASGKRVEIRDKETTF